MHVYKGIQHADTGNQASKKFHTMRMKETGCQQITKFLDLII